MPAEKEGLSKFDILNLVIGSIIAMYRRLSFR